MTIECAESAIMPFGKHKGRSLGDIADDDVLYLDWLIGQDWLKADLRECVSVVCESRSKEIDRMIGD